MQKLVSNNSTDLHGPAKHTVQFISQDPVMRSEATNEGLDLHRKESGALQSRRSKRIVPLFWAGLGWFAKAAGEALVGWGATSLLEEGERDKNEQNIQDTFDAISKNYDAIQRNYEAIRGVHNEVRKNTSLLLDVLKGASDTRKALQDMHEDMREKFGQVLESIRDVSVLPVVTSLKSFVQYFLREKDLISTLSDDEYLAKVREENDFLLHLKASRSPGGDSLRTSLFAIMDQGFAVPRDADDSTAFSALYALYYGAQTYASVMLFLLEQYSRLADLCYQEGDLEGYNKNFDSLRANFKSFKHSLVGNDVSPDDENSLIGNVIRILKGVRDKDFVQPIGENSFQVLSTRVETLSQLERQIKALGLPVIEDVPGKMWGKPTFPEAGVGTPLGDWVNGATVRYAVQYRMDGRYSKIGDWSRPMTVRGKANPILRIPVDARGRERLVFRQFNHEKPQLVGVLETKHQTRFRDINRDLFNAAHDFDADAAVQDADTLIRHGADVDAVFENGRKAIHAAALSDNVKLARDFLIRGNVSECDARDNKGYTPLHIAAEAGHSDFVEMLMEVGADVNVKFDGEGLTPLHVASYKGYASTVTALLKSDSINVNVRDSSGFTPLHSAVFGGVGVQRALMSSNSTDVNAKSTAGLTPLHVASVNNFVDVAQLLLRDNHLEVNAGAEGNLTALHFASMAGNTEMVNCLLERSDVDVNVGSMLGWTPLHFAIALEKEEAASGLLNCNRTDIDATATNGVTPLHLAAGTGQISVLAVLLARGSKVDRATEDGKTALPLAATNGRKEAITALLKHVVNIDMNARDGSVFAPSDLANNSHNVSTVRYLVEVGNADVNIQLDQGESLLHLASFSGDLDLVDLLVRKGADHCATNSRGVAPIIYAAKNGHQEAVKYLVERTKLYGLPPCYYLARPIAAYYGHLDIVKYLGSREFLEATEPFSDMFNELLTRNRHYSLLFGAYGGNLDIIRYLSSEDMDDSSYVFRPYSFRLYKPYSSSFLAIYYAKIQFYEIKELESFRSLAFHRIFNDFYFPREEFRAMIFAVLCLVTEKKHWNALKLIGMELLTDFGLRLRLGFGHFTFLDFAAISGNLEMVQYVIEDMHSDFEYENDDGMTPLFLAVQYDHSNVADYLMDKGALLSSKKNIFPLFFAAANGNLDMCKYLVSKGCDVNISRSRFYIDKHEGNAHFSRVFYEGNALSNAALFGHLNIVKYLVEEGAVTLGDPNGYTPLHAAAEKGHMDILKYLVKERGANIDGKDVDGRTPLDLAIKFGHLDTVAYLKRIVDATINSEEVSTVAMKNVNVKALATNVPPIDRELIVKDETLLAYAKIGDLAAIKYLAESGANVLSLIVTKYRSLRTTALHVAARYNHTDIIKYLVEERGADVNVKDDSQHTPLHYAAIFGQVEIVKHLVGIGADVDAKNEDQWTPLHYAAERGHLEIVKYLVGIGANPDVESTAKVTPLICALFEGRKSVSKYLIGNGVSCRSNSLPVCLEKAIFHDLLDVAEYLILKGADVNGKLDSVTPLHVAVRKGHLDMVQFLVAKGASVDATGYANMSLFQEAKLLCNTAIANFLETKLFHRNRRSIELKESPSPLRPSATQTVRSSSAGSGPASSGSGRPSSWMDSLAQTVLDAFAGLSHIASSPFKPGISWEQSSPPEVATPQVSDPQGSLFLLDLGVRKWTGQKRMATNEVDMTSREVMRLSASIAGKFMEVLGRAATHCGIALHRLDIDVAEVTSAVGRKIVGGRFNDIADEVISLVEEACPGREAGLPGRLSPKKFESFLHEIDRGFKVTLGAEMVQILHDRNDGLKINRIGRQHVELEPKGYLENARRDLVNPSENPRKQELL